MDDVLAFEQLIGRPVQVSRHYQTFSATMVDAEVHETISLGRIPLIALESFDPHNVSYRWADITAGVYDAQLIEKANELIALGPTQPVWFVYHHEPEDDVDSINAQGACGVASEFHIAWKHVHDLFRAHGVGTNVKIGICLMGTTYRGGHGGPSVWIPLSINADLDFIATDGYNRGAQQDPQPNWRSFLEVFNDAHLFISGRGKPMIIEECGCVEGQPTAPGDKGAWFDDALAAIQSWGNVAVFEYSNVIAHSHNDANYMIDTSQNSLTHFKALATTLAASSSATTRSRSHSVTAKLDTRNLISHGVTAKIGTRLSKTHSVTAKIGNATKHTRTHSVTAKLIGTAKVSLTYNLTAKIGDSVRTTLSHFMTAKIGTLINLSLTHSATALISSDVSGGGGGARDFSLSYLPLLDVSGGAEAHDLNVSGQVVGTASTGAFESTPSVPIRWETNRVDMLELSIPSPAISADAVSINDTGESCGYTVVDLPAYGHAVYWDVNGDATDIDPLAIAHNRGSKALAINNSSVVLLTIYANNGSYTLGTLYKWSLSNGFSVLDIPGGLSANTDFYASSINSSQEVVGGYFDNDSSIAGGLFWDSDGNVSAVSDFIQCIDINNEGDILGTTDYFDQKVKPFGGGDLISLISSNSTQYGIGKALSSDRLVVGNRSSSFLLPEFWDETGAILPLPTVAGANGVANAVSTQGLMVVGRVDEPFPGTYHAAVWDEVVTPAPGSGLSAEGDAFKRIDWFAFEQLKSSKLNDQAGNQLYLFNRKLEALMQNVSPQDTRPVNTPNTLNDDIVTYSEYREIETGHSDDGASAIEKNISFPSDLFIAGTAPVTFCSVIYFGNALKRMNAIIKNVNADGFVFKGVSLNNNTFNDNDKYALNIFAISPTDLTPNDHIYADVDWGTNDEKIPITSQALNQMLSNTRYLNQRKVSPYHKNVDAITKDPDPTVQLISDRVIMAGGYEEFSPDDKTFAKSQNTNDVVPQSFTIVFDLPSQLFHIDYQPVVIANVGPKNAHADGSIKKVSSILKKVSPTSFTLEIRENAPTQVFEPNDVYFCSYIAVGIAGVAAR